MNTLFHYEVLQVFGNNKLGTKEIQKFNYIMKQA